MRPMVSLIPVLKARGKFQNDTSVLVVKGAQKMAAASVYVPRVSSSCLSRRLSRSAGDLAPFKLLLLLWVPDHRRFCVHPFREESLFPTTLGSLQKISPIGLQAKCSSMCTPLPCAKSPGWWTQCWVYTPYSLGRILCCCHCPPVCGSPTWQYGFWLHGITTPLTCLTVVFFITFI